MKLNQFVRTPDKIFASDGVFATSAVLAAPAQFALSAANATLINSAMTAFSSAMAELEGAESTYRSAVAAKNDARANAEKLFVQYLQISYASPSVTNATLTSIGLDPKTTGTTPRPVTQPLSLSATPFENGYVNLKWKRNGNTTSTSFIIEAKVGTADWEIVASTTRTKVELSDYQPGVEVAFRVFAQKGDETSQPSNLFVIYANGGSQSLQIAA